jgi:hypothetical protein
MAGVSLEIRIFILQIINDLIDYGTASCIKALVIISYGVINVICFEGLLEIYDSRSSQEWLWRVLSSGI